MRLLHSLCINSLCDHPVCVWLAKLTHWVWDWVMHICISKPTIIGSDNGLSPTWWQAIIWTNAGILLIGSLGTNLSEILIEIHTFSFKKMHLKISSGKWCPFCVGLNVLNIPNIKLCRPHVGPMWILWAPYWDNVGPRSLAVRDRLECAYMCIASKSSGWQRHPELDCFTVSLHRRQIACSLGCAQETVKQSGNGDDKYHSPKNSYCNMVNFLLK